VLETIITNPAELLHLEFEVDGIREALVGTTCHPFYSVDRKEFVVAEQLLVGDRLTLADGRIATLASLSRESAPAGRAFTTFNLSVEEHRTYFVGQAAVWVHNMSQGGELCNLEPLLKKFGDALVKGTKESIEAFADQIVPMLKALPDNSKVPDALKEIQDALRQIPELPTGKIDEIFDAIRKKRNRSRAGV